MSNNLVIPHIKSNYFDDNPYMYFKFVSNNLDNDVKYIYHLIDKSYDQSVVFDDEYTYEDYLIDKLDYQNVSNKPLVYNIKYYKYIEPDGTYVYEEEYYQEAFCPTCLIQNTKYSHIWFSFRRDPTTFFVHYRMYPIWGAYTSPFKNSGDATGSYKITSNDAFGPMSSCIENKTDDIQTIYMNIFSPNHEEEFKFKLIRYPSNMCLNISKAGQSDKSKGYINLDKNAQTKKTQIGYLFTDDISDLIVDNNADWITYNFTYVGTRTRGWNYDMNIIVTENNTGETRVGTLTFTLPDGSRSEQIEVTQLHYIPVYAYIDGLNIKSNNTTSSRLTKIAWNDPIFKVKVKTNTTVTIRETTQLSMYVWPEFVNKEDYPIQITGNGNEQYVTFNVSSFNETNESRQGHIEFAMHDPIANKTYKFDKVIRQLPEITE